MVKLRPILQAMTIETPPPDPDGRPYLYYHFGGGQWPEWDFGESIGSIMDIEERHLEVSEGLEVVGYHDDGDEWMLVDATVDRFNPQGRYGGSWVARLDWSTFRRLAKPIERGTSS
jgi:hypothetical protein